MKSGGNPAVSTFGVSVVNKTFNFRVWHPDYPLRRCAVLDWVFGIACHAYERCYAS